MAGGPTMKGNIFPTSKSGIDIGSKEKENLNKLAEELFIDNVIPKEDQKNEVSQNFEPDNSMVSFDLSIKNYEIDSHLSNSISINKG
jgi:uncharacterized protein YozE (UPF0346 family)